MKAEKGCLYTKTGDQVHHIRQESKRGGLPSTNETLGDQYLEDSERRMFYQNVHSGEG
jgi:hypothetical protein